MPHEPIGLDVSNDFAEIQAYGYGKLAHPTICHFQPRMILELPDGVRFSFS